MLPKQPALQPLSALKCARAHPAMHVQGEDSNAGDTAGDRLFTLVAPFSAMHAATSWPPVVTSGTETVKLPALATAALVPRISTAAALEETPFGVTMQYTCPATLVVPVTVTDVAVACAAVTPVITGVSAHSHGAT